MVQINISQSIHVTLDSSSYSSTMSNCNIWISEKIKGTWEIRIIYSLPRLLTFCLFQCKIFLNIKYFTLKIFSVHFYGDW